MPLSPTISTRSPGADLGIGLGDQHAAIRGDLQRDAVEHQAVAAFLDRDAALAARLAAASRLSSSSTTRSTWLRQSAMLGKCSDEPVEAGGHLAEGRGDLHQHAEGDGAGEVARAGDAAAGRRSAACRRPGSATSAAARCRISPRMTATTCAKRQAQAALLVRLAADQRHALAALAQPDQGEAVVASASLRRILDLDHRPADRARSGSVPAPA